MLFAITGATGHTGSLIVKQLRAHDQQVRAIARDPHRLEPLNQTGAQVFAADLTDTSKLTAAFTGVDAVYVMIPPNMTVKNYRSYQDRVIDSFASALAASGVRHAVTLSSIGADKAHRTGPVVGLHNLEKRLSAIAGLNLLHLRAGYFMENTLAQAEIIHALDKAAGPLLPDLPIPMIASADIAQAAANALLRLDFTGHHTRELLGQRDITMTQAASILGRSIGKPDLRYVQLPDDQVKASMTQMGMSSNIANALLEMSAAMNSGHMKALEPRSPQNTTPTTYESFVADHFVPLYESRFAHA